MSGSTKRSRGKRSGRSSRKKGTVRSVRKVRGDAGRPFPAPVESPAPEPFYGLSPEESAYAGSRVVILPVPFGGTVTYGRGTERGPEAIRVASQQVELFDEETRREPFKAGIHTADPIRTRGRNPEPVVRGVRERVRRYLEDGKFVVTVGGEHSISAGPVAAYAAAFPGLHVVHFDAHSDLRESYQGSRHNHACAGARMREHARILQIGVRSQCSEEREVIDRGEVDTIFAYEMGGDRWIDGALSLAPAGKPVYVTVDLDYFDPSIMPSTGAPEPGGGEWRPTMDFLRALAGRTKIVGFDVMELSPVPGRHAPDFLAARLIYKLLAYSLG